MFGQTLSGVPAQDAEHVSKFRVHTSFHRSVLHRAVDVEKIQ